MEACLCAGSGLCGGHHRQALADPCVKTLLHNTHNSTTFCPAKDSKWLLKTRNGALY